MKKDKEYEESMTKEEAVNEIKRFFKGNKKFIDQVVLLIYSTHNFEKINSLRTIEDDWNWEKFLMVSIDTKNGSKHFYYRKGNKKFAPNDRYKGNDTHEIEEYGINVHYSDGKQVDEFTF